MAGGFDDEKDIADLAVADDSGPTYDRVINQVHAVRPPMVSLDRSEPADELDGGGPARALPRHDGVHRQASEARLGDRGCRPPLAMDLAEPPLAGREHDVMRPGQRDEQIDIEQPDPPRFRCRQSSSSSAARTVSTVSGGAPGGASKLGKPPWP